MISSKKDAVNILILIVVASAIGICIISNTVLIAEDGVKYINLAQRFLHQPLTVIKTYYPGYSILISLGHKVTTLFFQNSVYSWAYTAQSVSLLCRILTIIPLYFIGKILVGRHKSFWALLILIFLPYPAVFGSDVLRDWPHLLFLSTSMLCLMLGTQMLTWWLFALSGVISAIGHMIRPECAQVVIYGFLWFTVVLFSNKSKPSKSKAACLMLVLFMGFATPALPYVIARGKILPKKLDEVLLSSRDSGVFSHDSDYSGNLHQIYQAEFTLPFFRTVKQLVEGISDNLFHYFVPLLVIGFYCYFRRFKRVIFTPLLFILTLLVFYTIILITLCIHWGYISRRHCMPMVVFTVFFIPLGIEIVSRWISKSVLGGCKKNLVCTVLIISGVLICFFKLSRMTPLRSDKSGYLVAAKWVQDNISPNENIAVSDKRLAFYASRECYVIGKKMPSDLKYIVYISSHDIHELLFDRPCRQEFSVNLNKEECEDEIVICRLL